MMRRGLTRRTVLAGLALQGCTAPLPALLDPQSAGDARALLDASAAAHGMAALAAVADVSVSYDGAWRPLVGLVQPALVDQGFRGASQERLLLHDGIVAQAYAGPDGQKQVVRRWAAEGQGAVSVWFNGVPADDPEKRAAAALVADAYSLFLLGPMLLAGSWGTQRRLTLQMAAPARIFVGGSDHDCDVVRLRMEPGLGLSDGDDLALYLAREDRLMRRVRFTLNGLDSTKGAVADVDTWAHSPLQGVTWPTRFHEGLLRPLLLPVHDWRLTGLDLNRGLSADDLDGVRLTGKAAAAASGL